MRLFGASAHDHSHGSAHSHSHSHSHSHPIEEKNSTARSTALAVPESPTKRRSTRRKAENSSSEKLITESPEKITETSDVVIIPEAKGSSNSIRLSAYLNLIADFSHNITDDKFNLNFS